MFWNKDKPKNRYFQGLKVLKIFVAINNFIILYYVIHIIYV